MIAAEARSIFDAIGRMARARCASLGPRFAGDERETMVSTALESIAPMLAEPPPHLSGHGWPATEDERGYLDAELDEMADAWRSRVLAYARKVVRNCVADLVTGRGQIVTVPYGDDTPGDDEHALQGASVSGVCPIDGGARESRFASAAWASANEDEVIASIDRNTRNTRAAEAGYGAAFADPRYLEVLAEVSPESFGTGVPLIASFDRAEFWDRLRAFAARQTRGGEPSTRARARILASRSCPEELALTSDTRVEAIYQLYRSQEKVRSFRGRAAIVEQAVTQ